MVDYIWGMPDSTGKGLISMGKFDEESFIFQSENYRFTTFGLSHGRLTLRNAGFEGKRRTT